MSQQAVEGILGRLITDEEFRGDFFRDPQAACESQLTDQLTSQEVAALARIDPVVLSHLAAVLDPKIVRAVAIQRSPVRHAA
jgi:hypothetical protein